MDTQAAKQQTTKIVVLGAGRMGSALVRAFLEQGHTTTIWNRTRAKAEPLAARGARIAETVLEAVSSADIVVANLSDYAASDRLLRTDAVTRALRGKLLVQLASGSPRLARESAAWAREHGVDYLDGAIMATPNYIGQADATLLYAGPKQLFERHQPTLRALGGLTLHVGEDVGHASALDSALLVAMWGAMFGVLQGVAVCAAEGLPLAAYMAHVKTLAPVIDGAVVDFTTRIEQGRFAADESTLASIESHVGALHHLIELCRERGIDHAVPDAFDRLFNKAIAAGHTQGDFAVLHRFMR